MMCYHRKHAWITSSGLVFKDPFDGSPRFTVPCGKCDACRLNNSASWATRIMHESQYCDCGCFLTLTYSPEFCPSDYSLCKKHLQDFNKRLRIWISRHGLPPFRAFLGCGEYGSKFGRPHYHELILGFSPSDLQVAEISYSGLPVFRSQIIEDIWGKGICRVGTLTSASAGYVARYAKKIGANVNVGSRLPCFTLASRNIPLHGIAEGKQGAVGAQWCLDNHASLQHGYITTIDEPTLHKRIPDYYFDLLQKWFPDEYSKIKQLRYDFAMSAQGGVEIIDVLGKPTPFLVKSPIDMSEEELIYLADFIGDTFVLDIPRNALASDDVKLRILDLACKKVARLLAEQSTSLEKLQRRLNHET